MVVLAEAGGGAPLLYTRRFGELLGDGGGGGASDGGVAPTDDQQQPQRQPQEEQRNAGGGQLPGPGPGAAAAATGSTANGSSTPAADNTVGSGGPSSGRSNDSEARGLILLVPLVLGLGKVGAGGGLAS